MFESFDIDKLKSVSAHFKKPKYSISGELKDNFDGLILSDQWPNEVPQSMVVKNDQQVAIRAKSIVHSYGLPSMRGKKFLDFGCGNGSVAIEACKLGLLAYGYDVKKQWSDELISPQNLSHEIGTVDFSTDIDDIILNGPYDFIGVYDVIDHIMTHEEAVEAMSVVKKCSTSDTVIKVRCHPWTSKHGGHLYETVNKAFAHILLSDEEYNRLATVKVRKITRPLIEYDRIFDKAGFTLVNIDKSEIPIDPIFTSEPLIAAFEKRLNGNADWQSKVLPMTFIDYVLKSK
jgi:hypothetical protein